MKKLPKKVLILGSGALKIGEAGEFDYSGSQAIKAMKEEGIKTILINPNIATNQTSKGLADTVYFLPVNTFFVEKIITKERPDTLLLSFGGQTALNCGLELEKKGILKKYNVKVLGTPIATILKTEDRALFCKELKKINAKTARSIACLSKEKALTAATTIGYPVIVRAGFTLGGRGSGFAYNKKELIKILETAFSYSHQILIEECLKGWKEIEYEVVRDANNNCITVCNMENLDPLGIHTGESIVIAPSQTLTNSEYFKLREISIRVIRHLGIVGECNIQFALDPLSEDYRIIEVNARLSRSSALASKATGYPLAYIAAKLGLGYLLPELENTVTRTTKACFEPALDYLVIKIPRWDLDKFRKVSHEVTSEMKSVGEIMAIGRKFEEVLQKGLRMLQIGAYGLTTKTFDFKNLETELLHPTPKRIFAIAKALHKGWSINKINKLTGIDPWFLYKIKNIVDTKKQIKECKELKNLPIDLLKTAKQLGFSDAQLERHLNSTEEAVRKYRKQKKVLPVVKQIDTLAAEFPAQTNYLYLTYNGDTDDITFKSKKKNCTIVLGSGSYCIGSSVEFDWCCVNAIETLTKNKHETIMINYNPETVSTDYDICDKLYFEELSLERVLDIYDKENPTGVIVSVGGQIPNNLAMRLSNNKVPILGTTPKMIDQAEDRHKFSALLDQLEINQPLWQEFSATSDAIKFAKRVHYPVLVRPSYVLSGAAISVAHNEDELKAYLSKAVRITKDAPVVISKFETGAKEIEMDAVAFNGDLIIWAISEHIENAGVHSGDATIVLPPQRLYLETMKRIKKIGKEIAKNLQITGPFNIQFLAKENQIKVIECNLRASRSFPFASKVTGHNFIEIATQSMLGKINKDKNKRQKYVTLELDHVGIKAAQFSFSRLKGADPVLGVEMASTGEVACFGDDLEEAILKSLIAVGVTLPKKNILLSIGRIEDKASFLESAKRLRYLKFNLFATNNTFKFLSENKVKATLLHKVNTSKTPNISEYLTNKKIDFVINIPKNYSKDEVTDGYLIRRKAIDNNISLLTNLQLAKLLVQALEKYSIDDLKIKSWDEY